MAAAADLPEGTATPVAEAGDKQAVIQAVEDKYKDIESIQADFVQTTHSEIFGDEVQSGNLVIKRPAKMRWDFTEAGKQFITDGETMWVYTKEDAQVIRFDNVAQQADAAQTLLASLDKLDEVFLVDMLEGEAGTHSFLLMPRKPGQVKKIQLVLTTELMLKNVKITDAYDSITELSFTEVQVGVAVEDALFDFAVPEGVEIITAGG